MIDKIVCCMTSWRKRIKNVSKMVDLIKNQTLGPDNFYLTLSSDEFPSKNDDLPKDLVDKIDDWFKINWVKENSKTMKKVFPILQFLNPDDIIIYLDDDMLKMPKDLLEKRIVEFSKYNKMCGITENGIDHLTINGKTSLYSSGCAGVVSKKMLNGWEKFMTPELFSDNQDDQAYTNILLLNGYIFRIPSYNKPGCFNAINYIVPDNVALSLNRGYNILAGKILYANRVKQVKNDWNTTTG